MSAPPENLVEAGLAKIDDDLAFLMGCLREVLVELGEGHLARVGPPAHPAPPPPRPPAPCFSTSKSTLPKCD